MKIDEIITKVFGCLIDRSILSTDSPLQVKRKRLLIPLCIVMLTVAIAALLIRTRVLVIIIVGWMVLFGIIPVLSILLVMKSQVSETMITYFVFVSTVCILLTDISSAAIPGYERFWSFFIIVIDVLFIMEAHKYTSTVIFVTCICYLFIMSLEATWRFGILDFKIQDYEQEDRRKGVSCLKLPCATTYETSVLNLGLQIFIFVVDFVCTRGFALGLIEERNHVRDSIVVVNEIATLLSKFDLTTASKLLSERDHAIPTGLRVTLDSILNNLRSYQPYLPQSCFCSKPSQDDLNEHLDNSILTNSLLKGSNSFQTASNSMRSNVNIPLAATESGMSIILTDNYNISMRKSFQFIKASLMVVNINNSMSVLEHSLLSYDRIISILVKTTFDSILKFKGTPDVFLGDRMFANFGASRRNITHAKSCFDAASLVYDCGKSSIFSPHQDFLPKKLELNIGLSTGQVACGDLGNFDMLRFSIIGRSSQFVCVVERIGSALGIPIATDSNFHKSIYHIAESRIILQQFIYDGVVEFIFQVAPNVSNQPQSAEWMYAMQNNGVGIWDDYNVAVAVILSGDPHPQILSQLLKKDGAPYDGLRKLVREGVPPPVEIPKR